MIRTIRARRACLSFGALLAGLWSGGALAAIDAVDFPAPAFRPAEGFPVRASQAELQVRLDASPSRYRLDVMRVGSTAIVATRTVDHPDVQGVPRIHPVIVPLVEGDNMFTVRAVDQNQRQFALSSGTSPTITRDLASSVTAVRLDHTVPMVRVTNQMTVDLVFTIQGVSATYEVDVEQNGGVIQTTPGVGPGQQTLMAVPLVEGDNFLRLIVRATDPRTSDVPASSNLLRVIRDTIAPPLNGLIIGNPPLPTTRAVVNIQGSSEPFAVIHVDNGMGFTAAKRADSLGNFSLSGIELPLVLPGPTLTMFQVRAVDLAGNSSATVALPATRMAGNPRFEFLRIEPFDGAFVDTDVAVQHFGLAGLGVSPYEVRFTAQNDGNLPRLEEVLPVVADATPFQKDTILTGDSNAPGVDVVWSFRAQVRSTAGDSDEHFLGAVTVDVADPPAVVPLDAAFDGIPVIGSPTFTFDGAVERFSSVQFVGFNGVQVQPRPLIETDPSLIAQGAEVRAVIDVTGLSDGDYSVTSTVIATSGRTSAISERTIPFVLDRTEPVVAELRADGVDVQSGRLLFRRGAQLVRFTIRVLEEMIEPPELFVTQQGMDAVRAVFDAAPVPGRVFDYLYVTDVSQAFDGPAEVVIVGGGDRAGNPVRTERRFPQAIIVDTRPPIIDSIRTEPRDGMLITSATPIRVTMVEPPDSAVPASGPDPANSTIRVFGPLETTPMELQPGQVQQLDSQTLIYTPDPGTFDEDGSYQVEVEMSDRAGNVTTQVLILNLDSQPPGKEFVLATNPSQGAALPTTGLLTDADGRQRLTATFDVTSPGDLSLANSTMELRNFCPVPFAVPGTTSTTLPDMRSLRLDRNLPGRGASDGLYTLRVRAADPAGNLQDPVDVNFVLDDTPPSVLDGNQLSFPGSPIPTDRGAFPLDRSIVRGPLRQISSLVQDGVAGNGFTGSGIKVDPTTGTNIVLTLVGAHPTTTAPVGFSTATSNITTLRFEELGAPQLSPCFLGLRRSRVLLDLFTDPVLGDPAGLPADGTFDGEWEVRVNPIDRAGNEGPTSVTRFTYDTVPPVVEVDMVLNDRVYTGNRLILTGIVRDNDKGPDDEGQGIRRVQVQLEAEVPTPLTTFFRLIELTDVTLTPDPSLVEAEVELPWRVDRRIPAYEGPARLVIRAEDMAGNETFLVRELVLDVDPLPAPRLIQPLNQAAVPGARVRFEWDHVEGASQYELTIRDDAGNDTVRVVDFPFRFADVNLSLLAAGRYTWTVRAVDTGGTRGTPAFMRAFTLDQELPRVTRVFPFDGVIPDAQAGSIFGGQVRVAVEFSEEMDTSRPPTILFDPADPASPTAAVTQLEYDGNLWRGHLDIPPAPDAPDVNGLATIIIRDAFDRAGNPVAETREKLEVDIGPFWEARAFANPILKRELIFYFRARDSARGPLEEIAGFPDITIQQEGATHPRFLNLHRMSSSIFYGTYEVDQTLTGNAVIRITATDVRGNTTQRALSFSVAALLRADRSNIRFASGALKVAVPALSARQDEVLAIFPPHLDAPDLGSTPPDEPPHEELELVRRLDKLIPGRVDLTRPGVATLGLADAGLAGAGSSDGLGLYRREGNRYVYLPGRVEEGVLAAEVDALTTYYLMRDGRAPRVAEELGEGLGPSREGALLRIPLADRGAGIDGRSLEARYGGRTLRLRYQVADEELLVELPGDARPGEVLDLQVGDRVGNLRTTRLAVSGGRGLTVLEAVAYPNPARRRSRIRYRTDTAPSRAAVRIFDAAGRRLRVLDGQTLKGLNVVDWDLRDGRGRPVANGVYLAEVSLTGPDGRPARSRLKIAVLR